MQNDLVSKSEVIEEMWNIFNSYANDSSKFDAYETEAIGMAFKTLQSAIESKPVAYDVEKVVEQLEKEKHKITKSKYCKEKNEKFNRGLFGCIGIDCFVCCAEHLIEIVRTGGEE